MIPLDRTGRNPEVEEVLGALSLLLNGGGVAQLKTITQELNKALEGREGSARSVLDADPTFMTQLDDNKADIVDAIESLNRLAISAAQAAGQHRRGARGAAQRAALDRQPARRPGQDARRRSTGLSGVGVRVIKASKDVHDRHVRQLQPVLTELADSGDNFAKAFSVFLTYPFVDEVVGRDPQVARNLHMGDYTNLSIEPRRRPRRPGSDRCPTGVPPAAHLPAASQPEKLCRRRSAIKDCLANRAPRVPGSRPDRARRAATRTCSPAAVTDSAECRERRASKQANDEQVPACQSSSEPRQPLASRRPAAGRSRCPACGRRPAADAPARPPAPSVTRAADLVRRVRRCDS